MKKFVLFALLLCSLKSFAQDDLFGKTTETKVAPRKGWILSINGDFDIPAADMAKRFGNSYRVGPSFFYKTNSNWVFGAKGDFILGNVINQDSVLINVKDQTGGYISSSGERVGVPLLERGYMIGLQAGWIWSLSDKIKDNGILFLTSVGFMQHKIKIFNQDNSVAQLRGDYLKGYDRLTNGTYVEEYVCYNYFAKHGAINFHIGLDLTAGFTQGRRDYLYDVMRPDNAKRLDILFGVRGGWYIPIFKRKSEEIIFE